MRAYIQAFRGAPWNEECEAAYSGFRGLGIDCVLFSSTDELFGRAREDIVIGGMLVMEHALRQYGIEPETYNYPEALTEYLGRRVWTIRLRNLGKESLPFFIKPVIEKAAAGTVIRTWDDMSEYESLDPETELLCSDVVHFVSEWRCFVRYGKIIGVQHYRGDRTVLCDRAVLQDAVRKDPDLPAGCCLDFGVTDDDRTLLVEMNDGYALGCYGLPAEEYAKLLAARWAELTGATDFFKSFERSTG